LRDRAKEFRFTDIFEGELRSPPLRIQVVPK